MENSDYIKFLNTLHNYGAKNEGAIAEANHNNKHYDDLMVERPITNFIIERLNQDTPHILLITGHAGDGKTSILMQVLKKLNFQETKVQPFDTIRLPNGKECLYIKDFSEFSLVEREEKLRSCLDASKAGKFVILVANTGPLLNTFEYVLGPEVQKKLIDSIDRNDGEIRSIAEFELRAINVAGIDNSYFVKPFLQNMLAVSKFNKCSECNKNNCCPIFFNRNLINENQEKVFSFLNHHFIWQQEHGKRLTIRQIIAQLSYAVTAGMECNEVKAIENKSYLFKYMFSNSLFGYSGVTQNNQAMQVQAIYDMNTNGYDIKPMPSDEEIFMNRDYITYHPFIQELIKAIEPNYRGVNLIKWQKAMRRMYILFNIETDSNKNDETLQAVFSKKFPRYLTLRNDESHSPNKDDKNLIIEAFSILFVGHAHKSNKKISITLKRGNSIEQSVQMLYGYIDANDIKLKCMNNKSCNYGEKGKRELMIEVKDKLLFPSISLPILNYLEDIRSGVIPTNIDPQLTHGIDSIKAQMLSLFKANQTNEEIEILVMGTKEWSSVSLEKNNDNWVIS